ncbi:MAG: thermonuclease family protein [Paludibacteraceae bacterium]|nr:thermonuclease family protein [Paludibacteraceae bacterium]
MKRIEFIVLMAVAMWTVSVLRLSAYQAVRFERAPRGKYRVVRIYDGDTFTILVPPDYTFNIRIQGIDAPERRQEFGMYARLYLEALVNGMEVEIFPMELDKWGRTAARCFNYEGKDIGLEMIKAGMAWYYGEYYKDPKYENEERVARVTQTGLWCRPNPMNPQVYRQAPRSVKRKN